MVQKQCSVLVVLLAEVERHHIIKACESYCSDSYRSEFGQLVSKLLGKCHMAYFIE